ncbi:class II aldolase/adducin family protein [Rubrobacter marinus]|uniref:class II aldolase/adducin family protein n=1 Tax=Rubrobacter marinus TaxID=2653852 RepID=UPI001407DBE1|nr:class II aldolase/adducin family protein [Rubrobacter marinus]
MSQGSAAAETNVREALAYGCKILALEGQGDIIWGHVTLRTPENPEKLYMKPAAMGLEEISASDLITVDLDGKKVDGERPRHSEVFIHTEIMRARPEVDCVVHTHPPHAVAFGSTNRPLLPVGHEGSLFAGGLPVFSETTDLIVTRELGEALAGTLGGSNAVLLQNHGLVAAGGSIAEAVMTAVVLERACRVQMLADAMGGARAWTDPEEALAKKKRIYHKQALEQAFEYYARRVRALEARGL